MALSYARMNALGTALPLYLYLRDRAAAGLATWSPAEYAAVAEVPTRTVRNHRDALSEKGAVIFGPGCAFALTEQDDSARPELAEAPERPEFTAAEDRPELAAAPELAGRPEITAVEERPELAQVPDLALAPAATTTEPPILAAPVLAERPELAPERPEITAGLARASRGSYIPSSSSNEEEEKGSMYNSSLEGYRDVYSTPGQEVNPVGVTEISPLEKGARPSAWGQAPAGADGDDPTPSSSIPAGVLPLPVADAPAEVDPAILVENALLTRAERAHRETGIDTRRWLCETHEAAKKVLRPNQRLAYIRALLDGRTRDQVTPVTPTMATDILGRDNLNDARHALNLLAMIGRGEITYTPTRRPAGGFGKARPRAGKSPDRYGEIRPEVLRERAYTAVAAGQKPERKW